MSGVVVAGQLEPAEREALCSSLRGLLADSVGVSVRETYRRVAELGLTSLCADDESGGVLDLAAIQEELGRATSAVPLLSTVLLNLAQRWSDGETPSVLDTVRSGTELATLTFGPSVTHQDGRLTGLIDVVELAPDIDWLAVAVADGIALVAVNAEGVRIEPAAIFDHDGAGQVTFDDAPVAALIALTDERNDALLGLARLGAVARASGSATRAVDIAVEYAGVRQQFGRSIGAFQAVQHKLANCHIQLRAVRSSVRNAADHHDSGSSAWPMLAASACLLGGRYLRRVVLEVHHTFGAIGYSEEHEAPRHFRQVHEDLLRYGGSSGLRDLVAGRFLDGDAPGFPEYALGADAEAFRADVRAWLAEHWSGERKRAHDALPFAQRKFHAEFAKEVGSTGWNGLTWPAEYGGLGRGIYEQLVLLEEFGRVDAPRVGASMHAIVLMAHGTEDQKQRYLAEILRDSVIWGIGYSEPDAGSDLAAIRTKAWRDGDEWVISGEKIWTTTYWGSYMFVAARTDPEVRRGHDGLSIFIVPTDAPGLTFRPTRTLYSGTFANVRYDDVHLPADALLGAENDGWQVLTSALATERGVVGAGIVVPIMQLFDVFCSYLREPAPDGIAPGEDPVIRDRVAELAAEIEAARRLMLDCAELGASQGGEVPIGDAAVSKVFTGELMERFTETAVEIIGMRGAITQGSPGAVLAGRLEQALRHSLMWVISLGTNEIQRNIIARHALGLRSR